MDNYINFDPMAWAALSAQPHIDNEVKADTLREML